MNRIKYFTVFLFSFFSFILVGNASGSASLTVSSTNITVGNNVTAYINLKNVAAWNLQITSSGATSGCSQKFVDDSGTGKNINKTLSVTCKSTSTGIIKFILTGDISSVDANNDIVSTTVNVSRSITVSKPIPKSSNNYLKSLSVEGAQLTPAFNKNTLEYTVELEPRTEKISVSAQVDDYKASVSGTGEKEVSEGINFIEVVVTAENGTKRTYVIKAIVKELEPIEVTVDGKKYNVVRKEEELTSPLLYEKTTTIINEEEIPAFYSDFTKFTLVGLKDQEGNIKLYIYDEKNNSYTLYNEFEFNKLILYVKEPDQNVKIPANYTKRKIQINNSEVTAYKLSDNSKYALIYGMNVATGEEHIYMYDSVENTIQRYYDEEVNKLNKVINDYMTIIIGLIIFSSLSLIINIFIIIRNRKITKKIAQFESNLMKENTLSNSGGK
ncbi:MAG: cadherin-like beta sandwich domain-containing protein [Mollicutes bacterium]|nr:cadherin-like beta sandwich domain-containing protein [Mollicutes bacterium]